jgi:drug/metabolite transporter (DMT)-like permease
LKGELLLALTTLIGGSSYLASKAVLEEISPACFIFYRFLLGALLLLILRPKTLYRLDRKTLQVGAGIGAIMSISMLFLFYGLKSTDTGISAFLGNSEFLIIPIVELIFFRSLISKRAFIAICIGFLGITLLVLGKELRVGTGELLVMGSGIGFAFNAIYCVRASRAVPVYELAFSMMMFSALQVGVLAFCLNEIVMPSNESWPGVLYLGVVVTGFRFLLVLMAQRSVSAVHTGLIYLLEPVVAALLGIGVGGEQITLAQGGGMFLMLGAATMTIFRKKTL